MEFSGLWVRTQFLRDPDPAVFLNADPDQAVLFLMRIRTKLFYFCNADRIQRKH